MVGVRSGWGTAATPGSPISWAWTRTRRSRPAATVGTQYGPRPHAPPRRWPPARGKKNARSNRSPALLAGARHSGRSDHGNALVSSHDHPHRGGTGRTRTATFSSNTSPSFATASSAVSCPSSASTPKNANWSATSAIRAGAGNTLLAACLITPAFAADAIAATKKLVQSLSS